MLPIATMDFVMRAKMEITFILPGIPTHVTGGSKIIFEYANRLTEVYPQTRVNLCYLSDPSENRMGRLPLPLSVKRGVNRVRAHLHPRWFSLNGSVRRCCIFAIDDWSVPDADWVFATAASTACGVAGLSASKGKKGYLIQGYETWEMDDEDLADTYRLGMTNIVIAEWLRKIVNKAAVSGDECICISNPVDTQVYYSQEGIYREPYTVAVLYHKAAHKGFSFAWAALKKVRNAIPDLRVEMFGACPPPDELPTWVHYTRDATAEQLRQIYSSASVYVCASTNEGYGLTCVEAMACGCALVVTDFAGSREYAFDGVNSIVVPVGDVDAIAQGVIKMLADGDLRERLAMGGVVTARGLDWGAAVDRFAEVLGIVSQPRNGKA